MRQAPLFAGALLLSGGVVAGSYELSGYLMDRRLAEASESLANLASVIADHANRSTVAVDHSVTQAAAAIEGKKPKSAAAMRSISDAPATIAMLDDIVANNPFLESVFIIGADGTVDARSRAGMISPGLLAGTSYMDELKASKPGSIHLSTPFQSYQFHSWMLNFSRRISAPNGEFLGAVAGIVKMAEFNHLFEKINLQSLGSISLVNADGKLLTWAPQAQMPFGSALDGAPALKSLVEARQNGVVRATSPFDHAERLVAVASAENFPVSTVVATGMKDVEAEPLKQIEWVQRAAHLAIGGIFLLALQLALGLDQFARRREQFMIHKQTAQQAATLDNAIENITQGLAMFGPDGGLILSNRRYAELYGIPEALVRTGAKGNELQKQIDRQLQPGTANRPINEPGGGQSAHLHLKSGRVIQLRRLLLPDGGSVSTHEDVTEKIEADGKIHRMATRDALTGLFNRFEFRDQLDRRLAESKREGQKFAIFYLDLDRFKKVNDTLGHPVGDALLRQVAKRILNCVREDDVVARLGGDEFALVQRIGEAPKDPVGLAERLIATLAEPFMIEGAKVEIGSSVGIAIVPDDSADADTLIHYADLALYHSKQGGRGRYSFFASAMDEEIQARRALEADLRQAIEKEQLRILFQPVVSVADRAIRSFEALVRWDHPERGVISPGDFISVAEETGVIVKLGDWVLREAMRKLAEWPEEIKVAVNVSPAQFRSPTFLEDFRSALAAANVEGSRVIVEITENVIINDVEQTTALLHELRNLGVAIAMDDFGTGYSSLSYLRRFPFDKVKIDKSFVGGLPADPSAASIVRAAVALAGALGIVAVAEGIETDEQMAFLAETGCAEAQGFLISRPLDYVEADSFLASARVGKPDARAKEARRSNVAAFGRRAATAPAESAEPEAAAGGGATDALNLRHVPNARSPQVAGGAAS